MPGQAGQSAFGTSNAFGSGMQQSAFGGGNVGRNGGSAFGAASSFGAGAASTSAFGNGNKINAVTTSELAKTYAGQVVLSSATMREDLGPNNRPIWKTSSYGPAKYEPNLLTGLDVSPEEMRLRAYDALKEGRITEYAQQEAVIANQADNTVSQALSNMEAAYQQALKNTSALTGNVSQGSIPNTFGQSQSANAFQRAGNAAATFGAPSAFGSPSTSAFGQSSTFGAQRAFGGSAAANNTSTSGGSGFAAFGNANTTSRPAFGAASAFGNSATPASAFGSISAFGSVPNAAAPAGNTTTPAFGAASTFGSSSLPGTGSAFGQSSAFGSSANAAMPTSAFGQTSAPGNQASQSSSASGQSSSMNAFGANQGGSAFGATPNVHSSTTPAFGNAAAAPSAFGTTSAFGQSTQPSAFGNSSAFPSLSFSSVPAAPSKELVIDAWVDDTPKEESLPSEILAMFKAEQFEWGKVPGLEPPLSVR